MILPNNGRIVIIDDKYKEAAPLINILSKKRIPFNYYSGENIRDFPSNPDENKLRILFLDLNIVESQLDIKTVISTLDPILKAIVPDNPNPYLLVIWSKKKDEFGTALEKHFISNIPRKIPTKIIFLHKSNYFEYRESEWHPQEGCIERIEADLNKELDNISLLRNLITWENIVHTKTSETLSEFSSFFPFDASWDKNSKAIMFHLAKSVAGEDHVENLNDSEKLIQAFESINSFLADKIETEIHASTIGPVTGIIDDNYNRSTKSDSLNSRIKSTINEKLHISKKAFTINDFEQGNIFILENHELMVERIIWSKIFNPENPQKLDEIRLASRLIQLDITPVCDYAQDKKYVRLLYGVLTNSEYGKFFRSHYYCLTPIINILNEEKILIFDFRFIETAAQEQIVRRNIIPSIKLRREICTDIQSQLSNQVNRPGISNV